MPIILKSENDCRSSHIYWLLPKDSKPSMICLIRFHIIENDTIYEFACNPDCFLCHVYSITGWLWLSINRHAFPDCWLGVNFLAVTGKFAFPILGELQAAGVQVDGYWADDACIDETRPHDDQPEAAEITTARNNSGWNGIYIGGTAFKKQREVDPAQYARSARIASGFMDVVVTSGVATGHAADVAKIDTFRKNCGDTALGLASGITPENAAQYADAVDLFMVATGINFDGDFYNIDPLRLKRLMDLTQK